MSSGFGCPEGQRGQSLLLLKKDKQDDCALHWGGGVINVGA